MDATVKFLKLKQLHENLHSKKGLINVSLVNNATVSSTNPRFIPTDEEDTIILKPIPKANASHLADGYSGKRETTAQATTSLLNAVKNIYEDSNVKLMPHKMFVGNISYKLTTSQLKTFFLSFGRVINAQIVKDRVKKRSKGYGFVTFSQESEVEKVLQAPEDDLILDGRILRVNRAEKKKRGRPIRESCNETDAKTSLKDFVRKYNETSEESKYSQSEEKPETLPLEDAEYYYDDDVTESDKNLVDISHLNDDTLFYIFSFLSIKDRVRVEGVCHRWLHLARQTWLFITHLDFKGVFRSFRGTGGLTDGILLSLFRRGCQNLKSLDLSHSSRLLTDYSLYLIGQNCIELQELNLSGVRVTMKSLKDLSSKCQKLKKIKLQRCYEVGEKALWWLFKHCPHLEYVDVGGNIRITGQCFFMLTRKCKAVVLDECVKLTDTGLQLLIKRCPDLEEINISNCVYLTNTGISALLTGCTKLRQLSFCKSPKDVSCQSLLALRNLTLVEDLQLAKQEAVTDDVLSVIGRNCPNLRFLNIEACHNVTDRGIQSLLSCFHLSKLVVSYLDKITDAALEQLSQNGNIRQLHARSCFNITDKTVEQLALHCPHLNELDLSGSERIRNRSLDMIEEYLGDYEAMSLVVGGTGITRERALLTQERFPNWSITTQNLSDHHLRVDFDPYMDLGRILPEYSDDEDEVEEFGFCTRDEDAEYYLAADDPSMWEYEGEWMS